MKLSSAQVYAYAREAGFSPAAAVTMTAIVAAESGNRTDAIGDKNLTQPGEMSVGLTQINYRPSRDRGNAVRDPHGNLDPLTNLQHAYIISGQGRRFTPWSTFTSGAYVKNLGTASKAAGQPAVTLPVGSAAGGTGVQPVGFPMPPNPLDLLPDIPNPLNWLGDQFGAAADSVSAKVTGAVRDITITVAILVGGVALVVLGVKEAVAPVVKTKVEDAAAIAPLAAAV